MRNCFIFLFAMVVAGFSPAATFTEDFSSSPMQDGWQLFGNTNLFQWDPVNQDLAVTWDSSQTNSYFYRPLGTILTRADDFHLGFDLEFQGYTIGSNTNQPYTFPVGIGFLNLVDATRTNFSRGSGINPVYGPDNLVEFDFFPAFDIFQPTIAQVVVSTNNTWLYNHDNLLDMPPGQLFHVDMDYSSAAAALTTTVTSGGTQYGQTQIIPVPANMDFRLAAVSVSSYSDQHADGSILAHGTVDNIVVTVPPPPVQNLSGALGNGIWQAQFLSRSNWLYTLQRTTNFQSWSDSSIPTSGSGTNLVLTDNNPPAGKVFYRVRANRP